MALKIIIKNCYSQLKFFFFFFNVYLVTCVFCPPFFYIYGVLLVLGCAMQYVES